MLSVICTETDTNFMIQVGSLVFGTILIFKSEEKVCFIRAGFRKEFEL